MHPIFQQMWEAEWDDAMPVGFIVTEDLLNVGEEYRDYNRVGTASRGWGDEVDEVATLRFRLRDDDGEVYYTGWLVDDDEAMSQDAALTYGANDAGCTRIEVLRDGVWVQEIA
jgi:hypothetical protein